MGKFVPPFLFLVFGLAYAYWATSLGQVSSAYFDSLQYLGYGRSLLESGVYGSVLGVPDMNREPGYGFYLAALISLASWVSGIQDFSQLEVPANVFWLKLFQAMVLFLTAGLCAFKGSLPSRLRWPFFLLVLLSPTCIGAMREIYSEALAIPLSLLLLLLASRALSSGSPIAMAGAGAIFGLAVLTKSYLYYASFAFFLLFLFLTGRRLIGRGAPGPIAALALCLGLGGFVAQQAWNARNHLVFGDQASEARLSIALAGKVARLHAADWKRDLPVALAASLGTNFCDRYYGSERCSRFDYRGCDVVGPEYLQRYQDQYKLNTLADRQLKRDMLLLYFERPGTQLFGTALELLRMFFFEAVPDSGTFPRFLQPMLRAWHILGSMGFWVLILISWARHWRERHSDPAPHRQLSLLCLCLIAYHAATMAQVTNVVRYVFPVLPFLYYFTADGISIFLMRAKVWTRT